MTKVEFYRKDGLGLGRSAHGLLLTAALDRPITGPVHMAFCICRQLSSSPLHSTDFRSPLTPTRAVDSSVIRSMPRKGGIAGHGICRIPSALLLVLLMLLPSICSAYRPGDIVPMSRRGQYHSVSPRDRFSPPPLSSHHLSAFAILIWFYVTVEDRVARLDWPPLPDICRQS